MPPKNTSSSRSRGRPRTRAFIEEPEPEPIVDVVDEEVVDDEDDTEEDPDWDSEEEYEEDEEEGGQNVADEPQYVPPPPVAPQMPPMDYNQFFQFMFQQMQRPPPPPVNVDYLALALPHRPPTFSGGVDPASLDDWQYRMTNIFRHISCPENRRVEVAVAFLDGPTLQWWRTRESTMIFENTVMNWERFMEELRSHFFSEHHLDIRRTEFLTLKQG